MESSCSDSPDATTSQRGSARGCRLPETTGTLRLTGLEGPVEVYRDQYGIPHARAGSVHDAFFAQGFVTAQDRLWQMEYDRRRATGRWAEYAGASAVEQDVTMRRFQIGTLGAAGLRRA